MKPLLFAAFLLSASSAQAGEDSCGILRSNTQSLMDAVAPGNAALWRELLDATVSQTDENGTRSGKDAIVAGIKPLPKGTSGHIAVTDWDCRLFDDTAVVTYVDDEHENYHGQNLHALYRATDTWHRTAGGWRMIASQVIALQQDPPSVRLSDKLLREYVGRYAVAPDYVLTLTFKNGELMAQMSGQKTAQPLKAELADVLFTPGQPRVRKIVERDKTGRVIAILSRREGRDVVMRRLN